MPSQATTFCELERTGAQHSTQHSAEFYTKNLQTTSQIHQSLPDLNVVPNDEKTA